MDIGEHPGSSLGNVYIITNADSVRMYKNNRFIKEYKKEDSPYKNLKHGPILIDDFIGDAIEKNENFKPAQAKTVKEVLNATAKYGLSNLPKGIYFKILKLLIWHRMKYSQAVELYSRYVGNWGGASTIYHFEAIKNKEVVKTVTKAPMTKVHIKVKADHSELVEKKFI
jgi:beta-galactosidase